MTSTPRTRRVLPAVLLSTVAFVSIGASVYLIVGGAYTTSFGSLGGVMGVMLILFGVLALIVGGAAATAAVLAVRGNRAAPIMAIVIAVVLGTAGVPAISSYVGVLAENPTDPLPYLLSSIGILATLACSITAGTASESVTLKALSASLFAGDQLVAAQSPVGERVSRARSLVGTVIRPAIGERGRVGQGSRRPRGRLRPRRSVQVGRTSQRGPT